MNGGRPVGGTFLVSNTDWTEIPIQTAVRKKRQANGGPCRAVMYANVDPDAATTITFRVGQSTDELARGSSVTTPFKGYSIFAKANKLNAKALVKFIL